MEKRLKETHCLECMCNRRNTEDSFCECICHCECCLYVEDIPYCNCDCHSSEEGKSIMYLDEDCELLNEDEYLECDNPDTYCSDCEYKNNNNNTHIDTNRDNYSYESDSNIRYSSSIDAPFINEGGCNTDTTDATYYYEDDDDNRYDNDTEYSDDREDNEYFDHHDEDYSYNNGEEYVNDSNEESYEESYSEEYSNDDDY